MKLKTKIEISSLSLHDALPISTVFFDPNLNSLYLLNPDATMNLLKAVDDEDDGKVQSIRSEEHTSELQSRPHIVCRLLLEKKKIIPIKIILIYILNKI